MTYEEYQDQLNRINNDILVVREYIKSREQLENRNPNLIIAAKKRRNKYAKEKLELMKQFNKKSE